MYVPSLHPTESYTLSIYSLLICPLFYNLSQHPQAASRGGAVYAFALEPFCLSPPGTCPHRYHAFLWIESCWIANNAAAYGGAVYSAQTVRQWHDWMDRHGWMDIFLLVTLFVTLFLSSFFLVLFYNHRVFISILSLTNPFPKLLIISTITHYINQPHYSYTRWSFSPTIRYISATRLLSTGTLLPPPILLVWIWMPILLIPMDFVIPRYNTTQQPITTLDLPC